MADAQGWPTEIDFSDVADRVLGLRDDIIDLARNSGSLEQSPSGYPFSPKSATSGRAWEAVWIFRPQRSNHPHLCYRPYPSKAFHPDQIHQTTASLINTPHEWDKEDPNSETISPSDFIDYVLVPHAATVLIADDLEIDFEAALEVLSASSDFGDLSNPDPGDQNGQTSGSREIFIRTPSPVPPAKPGKKSEGQTASTSPVLKLKTTTLASFPPPPVSKKNSAKKDSGETSTGDGKKKGKKISAPAPVHPYGTRKSKSRGKNLMFPGSKIFSKPLSRWAQGCTHTPNRPSDRRICCSTKKVASRFSALLCSMTRVGQCRCERSASASLSAFSTVSRICFYVSAAERPCDTELFFEKSSLAASASFHLRDRDFKEALFFLGLDDNTLAVFFIGAAGDVHQLRLETLLESALATLMLLHDAAITPVAHTTHTFEVLAALNRRISAPSTTATPHTAHISAPDVSATSPALDKDTKTTSMTYARAVSAETPRSPSPSPSDSDQSDIVIRLDCPDLPEYERAYPPLILYDIQTAIPGKLFAGVRWTCNKNLVLQIKPGTVSASYMIETYTRRIWDVLKPILRLPDNLPLPMFETGGSWHSVVFHNLPAAKHDCYALPHVQESLREGGFNHVVKAISILCDDQELERRVKNKIPISMRVSVLTEAAAQQLVDRGGHIVGGRFRATHYLAKPRTLAPRPKSVQNDE
ncbi:hypothetical protein B0H11DRAFT_2193450 [Mycena galericulata]|nr:hypothetical protein B0H11DRAFT_2193450 [Mycena galericulata]